MAATEIQEVPFNNDDMDLFENFYFQRGRSQSVFSDRTGVIWNSKQT